MPTASANSPSTNDLTTRIQAEWDRIVSAALNELPAEFGAALTACQILASNDSALTLGISPEARAWLAQGHSYRRWLEEHISAIAGHPLGIIPCTIAETNPTTKQDPYTQAENHPLVRSLLRRFDGDIIAREHHDRSTWLAQEQNPDT